MQQSPLAKGELAFGVWSTEDRRYGQITEFGHQESNGKLCNGTTGKEKRVRNQAGPDQRDLRRTEDRHPSGPVPLGMDTYLGTAA